MRSGQESEVVLVVFRRSLVDEVESKRSSVSKRVIIFVVDQRDRNHVDASEAVIYFDVVDPVLQKKLLFLGLEFDLFNPRGKVTN